MGRKAGMVLGMVLKFRHLGRISSIVSEQRMVVACMSSSASFQNSSCQLPVVELEKHIIPDSSSLEGG